MCVLNKAHSRFTVEPILRLIDDVLRFLESVDVNNHHFDIGTGGKLPHVGQLGRVVDEVPAWHVVVLQAEMLLRDLKGFVDALRMATDGTTITNLVNPYFAVQLKDGLGVDVGLAGASFHLNTELAAFRCGGQGQVIPLLDGVHIGGQCFLVNVEKALPWPSSFKKLVWASSMTEKVLRVFSPGRQKNKSTTALTASIWKA